MLLALAGASAVHGCHRLHYSFIDPCSSFLNLPFYAVVVNVVALPWRFFWAGAVVPGVRDTILLDSFALFPALSASKQQVDKSHCFKGDQAGSNRALQRTDLLANHAAALPNSRTYRTL
jgi:hypothetical protein